MAIDKTYLLGSGITLAGGFDLQAKAPLDSRATVPAVDGLEALSTGNAAYEGMIVYVEENKLTYQYVKKEDGSFEWKEFGFNSADFEAGIADNLTSEGENKKALSANQGFVLKGLIDGIDGRVLDIEDVIGGLSGAMHFIGVEDALPESAEDGDVVLVGGKEYVWANEKWNELGDEASHALKTITITGTDGLTGGGDLSANRTISLDESTKAILADVSNKKDKQTALGDTLTGNQVLGTWSQNENGELTITPRKLTPADIGAQPADDYKTIQPEVENEITDPAHVLDSLTQDANGNIEYSVRILTPEDIGAKAVQSPVSNPAVEGKSLDFIATITQDENGVITATRASVDLPDYTEAFAGKKNIQEEKSFEGSTIKTVTKVEQNANGEIDVTFEDIALDISGKKDKQKAVTYDPEDHKWINSISQNENGEITATLSRPSGYDLEECATAKNSNDEEVPCLIFYCGTASDLV